MMRPTPTAAPLRQLLLRADTAWTNRIPSPSSSSSSSSAAAAAARLAPARVRHVRAHSSSVPLRGSRGAAAAAAAGHAQARRPPASEAVAMAAGQLRSPARVRSISASAAASASHRQLSSALLQNDFPKDDVGAAEAGLVWRPPAPEAVTSAYLHLPFCRRRCYYCDFAISVVGDNVESPAVRPTEYRSPRHRKTFQSQETRVRNGFDAMAGNIWKALGRGAAGHGAVRGPPVPRDRRHARRPHGARCPFRNRAPPSRTADAAAHRLLRRRHTLARRASPNYDKLRETTLDI